MSHLNTCSYNVQQRSFFDYLRGKSKELARSLCDRDKFSEFLSAASQQEHFYTVLISSACKLIKMVVSTDGLEDMNTEQ